VATTKTSTRKQQQTANQRSNLVCEDLTWLAINKCGPVNRSPSNRRRVQWPDQGRFGPPCRPVASIRFKLFILLSLRYLSYPPQIYVERRLWATSDLQSRPDPGRIISETGTTTR